MECRYFESCGAALCPLDPKIEQRTWFSGEEICRLRKFTKLQFIQNQRRLNRKQVSSDYYFTYDMVKMRFRVSRGLKGLDPEKERGEELEKWMKKHPVLKKTSPARLELLKRMRTYKKGTCNRVINKKEASVIDV